MSPVKSLNRTRHELSEFVRQRRERVTPAEVGLPSGSRRRTPGLRREEVAALAGVGITWYTWFEQGRDINVSETFLLSLSRVLKLDDEECCHLFLLAQQRPPTYEARQASGVSPLTQAVLDQLDPCPAYVMNLRWDLVAWNGAADRWFRLSDRADAERNLLRLVFRDAGLRGRMPDWEHDARRLLANFRCDLAVAPEDPTMLAFVDEMRRLSESFRNWWAEPDRQGYQRGISRLAGKGGRVQSLRHEMLIVDEHHHLRMLVYFNDETGNGAGGTVPAVSRP
ncbi:XRE family transcriptional regulator [Alcanivorax xiamenensis]|uniref:XRE family transcriptional regulator n=1 Tax=Alcanivorax xiamenensis TaxID=1177156 RepID=A0ABQ6Y616_9GAMM|nr:helix-turn-helix transcriptional regulator [Alcanivorax xiamenensis]KAF0804542.1 XRE family transcriptional regulator [Alcanivorax xiamenensis]